MKKIYFLFFLVVSVLTKAQVIYNAYAKITAIAGGNVLSVSNVNEANHTFNVGDLVIVMQMQDDCIGTNTTNVSTFGDLSSIQNAGRFEVAQISAKSPAAGTPTTITLGSALVNTYNTGANSSVQIITFRKLSTTVFTSTNNITGLAWDGNVGGVIAIEVGTVFTLAHNISANGIGFRGGPKNTPNGYSACDATTYQTAIATRYAGKGEGIYKNTTAAFEGARGKILTGGGGGNDVNAGGGGGGNYTAGGDGGVGWTASGTGCSPSAGGLGGIALSSFVNASRVYMGGGGGGGHENNSVATPGAQGGGIILLKTGTLVTSGTCGGISITANGNTAGNGSNDGAGGGGAAGSMVFQVNSFSIVSTCTLNITGNGGNGGNSNTTGAHGGGGGGAQGVVIFSSAQPTTNVSTSTNSGNGGSSCSGCGSGVNGQSGGGPSNSGIIGGNTGVLPVELFQFKVTDIEKKVILDWITITEKNTDYFTIERSSDAINWTQISRVKAAENSNQTIYYETYDETPLNGINYYRLKIVDLDLSYKYSKIEIVERLTNEPYVLIFPNPSSGILNLISSYNSSNLIYELYDITGKLIQINVIESNGSKIVLDISGLEKGMYILNISAPDGRQFRGNKIIHN